MKDEMNWKAAKEQCMIEGHRAGREGQLVETRTRDKLSNSLSIYKGLCEPPAAERNRCFDLDCFTTLYLYYKYKFSYK